MRELTNEEMDRVTGAMAITPPVPGLGVLRADSDGSQSLSLRGGASSIATAGIALRRGTVSIGDIGLGVEMTSVRLAGGVGMDGLSAGGSEDR